VQLTSSLAVSLAVFAGCSRTTTEPPPKTTPPAQVHLVRAKRGNATRSVVLQANVLPYQQATLYAKVGGYVKAVAVDKGDAVKEGALLADIEVPELIADRAKYQAELDVAAVDYKRVSEAQAKAPDLVIPQAVDMAKGKSDIAKANLERIDTLLGYAKITAPFAGVILAAWLIQGRSSPRQHPAARLRTRPCSRSWILAVFASRWPSRRRRCPLSKMVCQSRSAFKSCGVRHSMGPLHVMARRWTIPPKRCWQKSS